MKNLGGDFKAILLELYKFNVSTVWLLTLTAKYPRVEPEGSGAVSSVLQYIYMLISSVWLHFIGKKS